MVKQLAPTTYTPEKYLELETEAETRSEYINGEIVLMAGGTTNHNEIVTNLCLLLKPPLRQQKGKVYTENVRLWIPEHNMFTYPDVMVIAGEPVYYSDSKTTVTNPVVIIEVLSESTKDYDQGRKFGFYRSVDALQEYILVEPEKTLVMLYRRESGKEWSLQILDTETEILRLESVTVEIPLQEIYEGVGD